MLFSGIFSRLSFCGTLDRTVECIYSNSKNTHGCNLFRIHLTFSIIGAETRGTENSDIEVWGTSSSSSGDNIADLKKKIRIRGGRRAYLNKLMNNVVDFLKEDSIKDHENQLKTWKLTLNEMLQDLNSEIVDLVEAEEEIDKAIC